MEKDKGSETSSPDMFLNHQSTYILNSLPNSVAIYTREGYSIYGNKRFEETFGLINDHYLNHVNLFNDPTIPDEVKDAVRKGVPIETCLQYDFTKVNQQKHYNSTHNTVKQIKCSGSPIKDDTGKSDNYIFILEDITDKMNNEEALRNSSCKIEMAINAADIVLWEFDVSTMMFLSDNEPLNGYDKSEPLSIELYKQAIHPEDLDGLLYIPDRMCNGDDFSFNVDCRIRLGEGREWQYCTMSGSPYEYRPDGKVLRYVGTRKNNTDLHKKRKIQEKILNNIPLSIHIKDIDDNFKYVFCNEEGKKMFGTEESKTSYDIMDNEYAERLRKTDLEVFNTGTPYLGVEELFLKDGRRYETIVQKSIIEDGNKRLLLSIRWDQSLQNKLKHSAKLLSMTLEAMNSFTWFYEPDKDRLSFGDGFSKIGHKILETNSLEKYLAFVHPEDRKIFTNSIETFIKREDGIWTVEYRFDAQHTGKYQWWQTRGMIETTTLNDSSYRYMFGMTICIDAHKKAEQNLIRKKERLDKLLIKNELVLNNTNSGLAYIGLDYIVQWENISSCCASISLEAYKKGELCYKSAHNRTEPCENCVLQRALKSKGTEQIKFSLSNKSTIEVFATPVLLENGSVDGVVIRIDDVTERENMIEELRKAKKLAEESDKLKSAFLANMSHEIRTPLNAIVGFSELMMSCPEEDKQDYIKIINTNNELLLKLINDILDLSKIEASSIEFKYEDFDLSEYFDDLSTSMRQRITNPNIRFNAINPYKKCHVKLDRSRVAQLLTNYATNSIKYTPKGFIEMGYQHKENGIYLFVKDSGIGIQEDKKSKVFNRFEKLDDFAQGTGLGLSICKAIAISMGGSVGFESNYGEGSTFWAFLPCEVYIENEDKADSHIAAADNLTINAKNNNNTTGKKTILIAEDITSNYLLLAAILKADYNLVYTSTGLEAVETTQRGGIDLILMDMKMPVMDGLTATAEIRKFNCEVPIIALTAHAFDSDRIAALEAGCNEYLVKPINKVHLMDTIHKYC